VFDLREVVGQKIKPATAANEKLCGFCSFVFDEGLTWVTLLVRK
jgi:hypothetical protein